MSDTKPSILIVDDEKNTRDGLARALRREYRVRTAENGDRAMDLMAQEPPGILLTDLRMPGMDGLTLVQRALARHPEIVCLLLTAYGSVATAVEAMKRGAHDYLTKPVNLDELELVLQRSLRSQKVESENANLHAQLDDKYGLENIVGNSPAMAQLFDTIRQAAPTQATVLVQGESGTGKELVAHAVHRLSERSRGPFVAVHCAALSMNLLESELFGHEKGAFTGAVSRRKGRFELADGGTLFLDEISEIDASIQVKLLRVLEERMFERVGGDETIETDIRLITATNKKLKQLVKEDKFREDLFFRLDVVNITLPPLRARVGDVPMLCGHFLDEFNASNNREINGITSDAVTILSNYNWPGNVRELRNTIEKMVVLARGDRLTARDIPANIREAVKAAGPAVTLPSGDTLHGGDSLAATEQRLIMATLKKCNGNRTKAAAELGISRRTLHRKLKQYQHGDATSA